MQKEARENEMICKLMDVTPETAQEWLDKSDVRGLNKNTVDKIADDIKNDKWYLTNSFIAIADDGSVVDGMHRLSAIVKSGKTVQAWVCFGAMRLGEVHRYRTITPSMAKMWLDENRNKSVPDEYTVEFLTQKIVNGTLDSHSACVVISFDKEILDGIHLLSAIVKSNQSVNVMTVLGSDPLTGK